MYVDKKILSITSQLCIYSYIVEKSKTKCIIFTKYPINTVNILHIYLNDVPLPYVDHVKHLGCTLQTDNSFTRDINQKRGR